MLSCIVTGGSGFIGTHLIEELLRDGTFQRIYIFDIKPSPLNDPRVVYYAVDIRQPITVKMLTCDVIFHLAALCKEPGYAYHEYFDTNHVGTINVMHFAEANAIETLVFTSTMMVFRAGEACMSDTSPTYPDTAYGISKLLAEKELLAWQCAFPSKRKLMITRPAVVFGKSENGNYTRLYRTLKRGLFFYVGRKTTVKSSVYVKDVVRCLLWSLKSSYQYACYNLSMPVEQTIERTCRAFATVFGMKQPTIVLPYRLMWLVARLVELLPLRTSLHHRRIEKLYNSTFILPDLLIQHGFQFKYDLISALTDWKEDCQPYDLF